MAWLYSSLKGDKALYLLMTQNFLQDKGLTEAIALAETGATVNLYDGGVHSPLYPLLCAPILWVTKSFFFTQLLVAWVGWVFFLGLYKLVRLFFRQRWIANLFILCVGGFIYPQEMQSSPKDTIAAALTIWVVAIAYHFISNKPTLLTGAVLGILLAALCSIKIVYVPIAFTLFSTILLFSFLTHKQRAIWPTATMLSALFVGFLIYAQLVFPSYSIAASLPVTPNINAPYAHGFFPENLSSIYPFISSSAVETQLIGMQAEFLKPGGFASAMQALRWVDIALSISLVVLAVGYSKSIWKNKMLLLLILPSLAVIAGLIYKSITEEAILYKSTTIGWTYVADARNFLLPMLVLQLLLFRFVFERKRLLLLRLLMLLLFAGSAVHGYLFATKKLATSPFVAEANASQDGMKQIVDDLKAEKASGNALPLITSDKALLRYASVNYLSVYSFSSEQPTLSWMKKGDRFLVATHPEDSMYLQKLPKQGLILVDTIPPYIIHSYTNH